MIRIAFHRTSSLWLVMRCGFRSLPLFFQRRPGTPLRVMCVMAFDALSDLRYSKRLSDQTIQALAALLDLGACVNAELDGKPCRFGEFQRVLQELKSAGYGELIADYLQRLTELEAARPKLISKCRQLLEVRDYREAVAKLSLAVVTAIAFHEQRGQVPNSVSTLRWQSVQKGVDAIDQDPDLNMLFRLVMQCQILDDLWDYSGDLARRLPSFLTASTSLHEALGYTAQVSRSYGDRRPDDGDTCRRFPFQMALAAASACASLVITLADWRCFLGQQFVR
jgi:hypothetical protein